MKKIIAQLINAAMKLIGSIPENKRIVFSIRFLVLCAVVATFYLNKAVHVLYGGTQSIYVHICMTVFCVVIYLAGLAAGKVSHEYGLVNILMNNLPDVEDSSQDEDETEGEEE